LYEILSKILHSLFLEEEQAYQQNTSNTAK